RRLRGAGCGARRSRPGHPRGRLAGAAPFSRGRLVAVVRAAHRAQPRPLACLAPRETAARGTGAGGSRRSAARSRRAGSGEPACRAILSPPAHPASRPARGARPGARGPSARGDRRDHGHHPRERRGPPRPRSRSAAPFHRKRGGRVSDAEWNSWQSTWTGAAGPLPDVRARARKEVRLHRLANVAFFLLVAIALACLVPVFADRSSAVHMIGWIIIAFCAAMSIGYLAIQRG